MKLAWFMAIVLVLIAAGTVGAQPGTAADQWPYTVKHYTDENGLPQNSVKGITADQQGFIWLATESGLVRFDGQRFYSFNKFNTSLTSTRFYALQPDITGNKNRFYAFADNSEFLRVESAIAVSDTQFYRKSLAGIPHISESYNKTLLASGSPNYMFGANKVHHYVMLIPGKTGAFYILQKDKIAFFERWKTRWEKRVKVGDFARFFTHKGFLFYSDAERGIIRMDHKGSQSIVLTGDIQRDAAYTPAGKNFKIYWNNISDQTFILLGKNFYLLSKMAGNSWGSSLILSGFDLIESNIRSVHYESSTKRLFLGSVTNGLYVFAKKQFRMLRSGNKDMENIFYAQTAFDSNKVLVPNGTVLGLKENNRGDIWSAAIYKGALKAMQVNGSFDSRSMLTDRDGYIWSKSFNTLYLYGPKGERLLRSWDMGDEIKAIYEGKNGRTWVGTKGRGLFHVDKGDYKSMAYPGAKMKEISFLLQQNSSALWVATLRGLFLLDLRTGKSDLVKGTEKLNIRGLHISPDAPDGIFLLTYEDGVFLYRDKKLVQFPVDPNRYLAVAHCMVEDKKGFLWIPTNNGLFQAAKSDLFNYAKLADGYKPLPDSVSNYGANLFYMYYAKDQGFYTNEFNGGCQPCAVKLAGGTVSLPSLNGLVWFDPEKVDTELPDKDIAVSRMMIQGKTRLVVRDTIRLPLNSRQIEFEVSVPYYGNPNNLRLAYAFVPFDEKPEPSDWVSLKANDPVIRFSELGYGKYFLNIRKINGFGSENYKVKRILIKVPRHWYETWWYRGILAIMLAGAVYLYTLFRTRYLKKRNRELEIQVEKRTEKLQETLAALQISEKELSRQMHIQTRLIASISHDIRTPLRFIIDSAGRIANFVGKKEYGLVEKIGNGITSSGTRMVHLLENTIGYIKTQVYSRHVKLRKVLLHPIIQEKTDLFAPVIKEQANELVNKVDIAEQVTANAQLLGIVIHNIIDNANKYTFEGVITIETEWNGNQLHLIISDTGPGMPEHLLNWLNNSTPGDVTDTMINSSEIYNGLGLLIVKEISILINAPIFVENQNGTRFHLIFS